MTDTDKQQPIAPEPIAPFCIHEKHDSTAVIPSISMYMLAQHTSSGLFASCMYFSMHAYQGEQVTG